MAQATDEQMDALLLASLTECRDRLEAEGDFAPHAQYLDAEGRIVLLVVGQEGMPADVALDFESLEQMLRDMVPRGDVIGTAISRNMSLTYDETGDETPAVVTQVCAEDYAVDFVTVYELRETGLFRKKRTATLYDPTPNPLEENRIFGVGE